MKVRGEYLTPGAASRGRMWSCSFMFSPRRCSQPGIYKQDIWITCSGRWSFHAAVVAPHADPCCSIMWPPPSCLPLRPFCINLLLFVSWWNDVLGDRPACQQCLVLAWNNTLVALIPIYWRRHSIKDVLKSLVISYWSSVPLKPPDPSLLGHSGGTTCSDISNMFQVERALAGWQTV